MSARYDPRFYDPRKEITLEFGANLGAMLKKTGMNRKQLATRSGVSKSSIDNYMVGRCEPTAYAIACIAKAVGCTAGQLLGLEPM